MSAAVVFVAGGACSWLLWRAMGSSLQASAVLERQNYRGSRVPVACGILIALAALVVASLLSVVDRWPSGGSSLELHHVAASATTMLVIGFALLGLFDDLVGSTTIKGVRGHVRALRTGTITSGLVKLVGGVLLGLIYAQRDGLVDTVRGALLIAATANLANLFDRAPGRVIKVSLLGALVLVVSGAATWALTGPLLVVGAGVGLLAADLREELMLGDTGANALGAAIGFGFVMSFGATGQWIALVLVLGLNLASETVSFSRVIDRTPPLRWIDRLGTLPQRRAP